MLWLLSLLHVLMISRRKYFMSFGAWSVKAYSFAVLSVMGSALAFGIPPGAAVSSMDVDTGIEPSEGYAFGYDHFYDLDFLTTKLQR